MTNVLFILLALLVLCVIVVFHELGHYIAGRATGIGIEEFAVGMGPKLFSFTRKDIQYSFRLFPIGGFCKFIGEDEENPAENAMNNQPVWKRFVTILSGPLLNFVLAFLAMFIFLQISGVYISVPLIAGVSEGTPAAASGFISGDKIVEVDGVDITYDEEGLSKMTELIRGYNGEGAMRFIVERDGGRIELSVAPEITENETYQIGILLGQEPVSIGFFQSFGIAVRQVVSIFTEMIDSLRNMIFKGEGVNEAMGPVGIVSYIAQEARNGINTILLLIVIISMNLGIINLLPLPALDGGRLLFLIVEGIRRKPLNPEYEGRIHLAGFFLLIGVIIFFSYKDIVRLITG